MLSGVARLMQHAGQSRLLLTLTHAAGDQIKVMLANVRKHLDSILATAPQLTKCERWTALVRYIVERGKFEVCAGRRRCRPVARGRSVLGDDHFEVLAGDDQ